VIPQQFLGIDAEQVRESVEMSGRKKCEPPAASSMKLNAKGHERQ
jgi:hypothetical protein